MIKINVSLTEKTNEDLRDYLTGLRNQGLRANKSATVDQAIREFLERQNS